MGNGFWSPLERKRKSPVNKINGLTQVTPSTTAYAVAQVCFYSTFVQVTYFFRGVLHYLLARNGELKMENSFFKISMKQSWSFLKMKMSGWWIP